MRIMIKDGRDLDELANILKSATKAVARGSIVRFNLELIVGGEVETPQSQAMSPIDFPGYEGEDLTREKKSQQLISHLLKHFELTNVQMAQKIYCAPSGVSGWITGTKPIGNGMARKILIAFPCTDRFRTELLEIGKYK